MNVLAPVEVRHYEICGPPNHFLCGPGEHELEERAVAEILKANQFCGDPPSGKLTDEKNDQDAASMIGCDIVDFSG